VGVLRRRQIVCPASRFCPDGINIVCRVVLVSFVECDEEDGFLRLEDVTVQNQGDEFAEVVVSLGDRAVVHVVAEVWCEPHVIGSCSGGAEGVDEVVIWESFSSRVSRDHMVGASGRVGSDILVEDERVCQEGVVAYGTLVAGGGHVFHVSPPSEPCALYPIHDAGIACRTGSYWAAVCSAEVVVPAC